MKIKFGLLLPLAVLAAGAFVTPAKANPSGDRPTVGPAILAQRGETTQTSQARRDSEPIKGNNYVGVGGSNDGAVVNGKYALSNRFSIRPEVFTNAQLDDDERGVAVFAPVTYDFTGNNTNSRFQPFVGAGAGVTTGNETELQLVTTAGADIRLGNRYAINGSVNYLPLDDQQVDFVAGLGYRF
ncbi:MAG: hypothetical protein ACFB16_13860 [Phormidesmis sp.]